MNSVVISSEKNPYDCLMEGIKKISDQITDLKKDQSVAILIDTNLPQGYPATINHQTFLALIDFLKEQGILELYIIPGTLKKVNQQKTLDLLGITPLLEMSGIKTIFNHDLLSPIKKVCSSSNENERDEQKPDTGGDMETYQKIDLKKIDHLIVLTQIRTEPIFGLHSSMNHILNLFKPEMRDIKSSELSNGDFPTLFLKKIYEILKIKRPSLIINDIFHILEGNGPYIQANTNSKFIGKILISNDLFIIDWITYLELGMTPSNNPIFSSILRKEFLKNDNENQDFENFQEILRIPEFDEIKIIGKLNDSDDNSIMKASKNLDDFKLPSLHIFKGEMDPILESSFLQFLYYLDTNLYKDAYNLKEWNIVVGKNPPEPFETIKSIDVQKRNKIIVYGDKTIKSIEGYKFRKFIKLREVLKGDELERKIVIKNADYRKKIKEIEEDFELTLNQIIKNKTDPIDRELTTLEKKFNADKKILKQQFKSKKYRVKTVYKYKIVEWKNKIPKFSINKNVTNIEGDPPHGFDFLIFLTKNWSSYEIPTAILFQNVLDHYYDFPFYPKKVIKQTWKEFKRIIKKDYELILKPIKPEVEENIKKLKEERKEKLSKLDDQYKEELKKLKVKTQKEKERILEMDVEKEDIDVESGDDHNE